MADNLQYYIIASLATLVGLIYSVILFFSHTPRPAVESELHFVTTLPDNSGIDAKSYPLPARNSLEPVEGVKLSVVIPCYNEKKRLKVMLDEAIEHLNLKYGDLWEVVIVDDGSSDGTSEFALGLANDAHLKPGQLRVVKLYKNRGKGGAVAHGIQFIRGEFGIFADADGASKFSDVDKLIRSIQEYKDKPALAIGSRAHMVDTDAVVKRSFIRNFLMYSLHTLVFIFGIREIKDTQCGFKLFNKKAIKEIFPYLHTEGWIFDVEILIIAIRKTIPIKEIPISWHEVDGSKVDLARDSINMAIDLVVTRLAYILGIYKDK